MFFCYWWEIKGYQIGSGHLANPWEHDHNPWEHDTDRRIGRSHNEITMPKYLKKKRERI